MGSEMCIRDRGRGVLIFNFILSEIVGISLVTDGVTPERKSALTMSSSQVIKTLSQ